MSILDILTSGPLSQMLNPGSSQSTQGSLGSMFGSALESIATGGRNAANTIRKQTPGGMGGLLGAGALGAVLGNLMSSDAVKGIALAGAGAVAWNFYKKWAAQNQADNEEENTFPAQAPSTSPATTHMESLPQHVDPTAELVLRSMVYAARADGTIDLQERKRIDEILQSMLPGQNVEAFIEQISQEPLDPARIARGMQSAQQADDVYRLSCMTIDIDHFMERSYLDALAKALNLTPQEQKDIEMEASQVKKQLEAAAHNS